MSAMQQFVAPGLAAPFAGTCSRQRTSIVRAGDRHLAHPAQLLHPAAAEVLQGVSLRGDRRDVSVHATAMATVDVEPHMRRWWERGQELPNIIDVGSAQEFVDIMATAGDRLVIVDFYATWCNACRSVYPKLCTLAKDNEDILVLKVDFDKCRELVKPLGVKILPYFHFYRGADGLVGSFTASAQKVQRLRDAIAVHNTPRCMLGEAPGFPQLSNFHPTIMTHNIVPAPSSWQASKEREAAGV